MEMAPVLAGEKGGENDHEKLGCAAESPPGQGAKVVSHRLGSEGRESPGAKIVSHSFRSVRGESPRVEASSHWE
jgi:hypothetical protein